MSSTKNPSSNLNAAQAMLAELRSNYIRDLPSQFDELEDLVIAMGRTGSHESIYEDLYRRVHSLKGTAGTYTLQVISSVCHQFEDYLNQAQETLADEADTFTDSGLQYVDLLRRTHELIRHGQTSYPEIEATLSEIRAQLSKKAYSGLIVDASRTGIDMALQLLEATPVQFSVATDGMTALDRLLHEPFDIFVTGMQIPNLNGAALISAVRLSKSINCQIKSLLITASDTLALPAEISPDCIVRRDKKFMQALPDNVNKLVDELKRPCRTG